MMNCKRIALLSVILTSLISCDAVFPDKTEPAPPAVFDELWNSVNQKYVCFSNRDVDWDAVYTKYRGQINDDLEEDQLFAVLCKMLGELKDGHVSLRKGTREWNYWSWRDSSENLSLRLVSLYLGDDVKASGGMRYNTIRDGLIGYIRYDSFMDDITDNHVIEVLGRFSDCQGLILDLRKNVGGVSQNLTPLIKYLPCEKELFKSYVRHNSIRDDLVEKGITLKPGIKDENMIWRKPLIVLIDNRSFSASSIYAMCVKGSENVRIVGVKTAGGTDTALDCELSNGWIYRIPSIKFISKSGMDYKDGVPPDTEVHLDKEMVKNENKDSIIEAACEMILSWGH